MPSYGETQIPAGVNKSRKSALLQDKKIPCRNVKIDCNPKLYQVPYKGNAVLNANK